MHCKLETLILFYFFLMSSLTRLSKHRSGDRGTEALIEWPMKKKNMEGFMGKESSSSFSMTREVLSRANANSVPTCLKLVGDP